MTSRKSSGRVSLAAQLLAHVEVCDERYSTIETRLSRMEKIMLGVAGSSFLMLLAALGFLLSKLLFH
jgi:hypothetical protein